jgi:hypothetical protein
MAGAPRNARGFFVSDSAIGCPAADQAVTAITPGMLAE